MGDSHPVQWEFGVSESKFDFNSRLDISYSKLYQNRSTRGVEDVSTGRCGFVQRPGWLILLVLGDNRGVLSCGYIYAQRELGNWTRVCMSIFHLNAADTLLVLCMACNTLNVYLGVGQGGMAQRKRRPPLLGIPANPCFIHTKASKDTDSNPVVLVQFCAHFVMLLASGGGGRGMIVSYRAQSVIFRTDISTDRGPAVDTLWLIEWGMNEYMNEVFREHEMDKPHRCILLMCSATSANVHSCHDHWYMSSVSNGVVNLKEIQ